MSEDGNSVESVETGEGEAPSTTFDYADMDFSFVKDKFQAEGRSPMEALIEQSKSYDSLEKRFGSFTGAPDNYEIALSEEMQQIADERGISLLDTDHPRVQLLFEKGKELGLNQEGMNTLLELDLMDKMSEQDAWNEYRQEQIEALGRDGKQRLDSIDSWAKANMNDDYDAFISMAQDAASFAALEKLVNMTQNAPVVEQAATPAPSITMDEIQAEQFKLDEYGNRLSQSSPEHRAKIQKMYEQLERQQR